MATGIINVARIAMVIDNGVSALAKRRSGSVASMASAAKAAWHGVTGNDNINNGSMRRRKALAAWQRNVYAIVAIAVECGGIVGAVNEGRSSGEKIIKQRSVIKRKKSMTKKNNRSYRQQHGSMAYHGSNWRHLSSGMPASA